MMTCLGDDDVGIDRVIRPAYKCGNMYAGLFPSEAPKCYKSSLCRTVRDVNV